MLKIKRNSTLIATTVAVIAGLGIQGCQQSDPQAGKEQEQSQIMTESTTASESMEQLTPPVAEKRPVKSTLHGHERVDDYHWLRDDDRKDPEVLGYLEAENAYFEQEMSDTVQMQETLYTEMTARLKQDDEEVPVKLDDYYYYSRYSAGQDYKIHARKHQSLENEEEILLDENKLAEGHEFFSLNNMIVTDDHKIMAWTEDTVSRRLYTIRIRNIETGEVFSEEIVNASGAMAFAADNKTLFYAIKDEETLLPYQIYRHVIGTPVSEDVLVYEEKDNTFYTSVYRGKSNDYIYMVMGSTISDEAHLLDASDPTGEFTVFLPREDNHEYNVTDVNGQFFVRSNRDAVNFRIMKTTLENSQNADAWEEFVPHSDDVLISGMTPFADRLVVSERSDGLRRIRIVPFDGGEQDFIKSDESAYAMYLDDNVDVNSTLLRYGYTSMTTPYTIYDLDLNTGERTLLKQTEVIGDFTPDNYRTERVRVTARDGTAVPVSLVYHKDTPRDGSAPLLVYGYGSYGNSIDPTFRSDRLSLLDRGFVFAMAHVRGGQEMGRRWYDDGKMFNKMNTFTDFVDVSADLVKRNYGDSKRLYAYGGSAGGLLMGVVINISPELYHGVVAAVPFVDVINTMLDESIPLTTGEFNEWGNPKIKEQYEYIVSYSPYDQVRKQDYPNLLITTGLHDSQVQYFEPAKWIAKLRDYRTDDNLLLMYTDMDAGHGGASGRFKRYRDVARMYAFFIKLANQNTAEG